MIGFYNVSEGRLGLVLEVWVLGGRWEVGSGFFRFLFIVITMFRMWGNFLGCKKVVSFFRVVMEFSFWFVIRNRRLSRVSIFL